MNKTIAYLKKLKNIRFGFTKATTAAAEATDEQLIFPAEEFFMPAINDVFGQSHSSFMDHKASIPAFYVRSFKNALCFTNQEEIYSSKKDVIIEYTTQKVNPKIGESKKIFYRTKKRKVNATVVHLCLSGLEINYYHFLTECLARVYLLEKSKFKPEFYVIANELPFQAEMLGLLGIDKDRIIPTEPNLLLQVETLIVPDFINNWEWAHYRGIKTYQKQWAPTWVVNLYREKITLLKPKNYKGTKIYISRDRARYRTFENKQEVNALFAELGFETYYLEEMNVTQQIEVFANAEFVAGLHGSGFANLYFANAQTRVFEIFPEYYHDTAFKILAKTLNLNYSYLVGQTILPKNIHPQKENTYIDIDILKQALIRFINL